MKISDTEIEDLKLKHQLNSELYQNTENRTLHHKISNKRRLNKKDKFRLCFNTKEIHLHFYLFNELLSRKIECYLEPTIWDNKNNKVGEIDIIVKINDKFIGIEVKKHSQLKTQNLAKLHKTQLNKYLNLGIPIILINNNKHILLCIEFILTNVLHNKVYGYFDAVQRFAPLLY